MPTSQKYFITYPPNALAYERPAPDRSGMEEEAIAWAKSLGWEESEEKGMWMARFSDNTDGPFVTVGFRFTCPLEILKKSGQYTGFAED